MPSTPRILQEHFSTLESTWDHDIIPTLMDYLKIPNRSPAFDPDWETNGYMDDAMTLIADWCQRQPITDLTLRVLREPGKTPLLYLEIPGQIDNTILLYGHIDKQPEMTGWDADKGPWQPVLEQQRLYGRGSADDGYAVFSSLSAIAYLQQHQIPHARCVVVIESCEESGSHDLPDYLEQLRTEIGSPDLVICLDSSCGNYQQMWGTTSLRGMISGTLQIKTLTEGIHSGMGSGVVPSTTQIMQQLLQRIEDPKDGQITLPELIVDIPNQRQDQIQQAATLLGDEIKAAFPLAEQTQLLSNDPATLLTNKNWRAALSVIGIAGLPDLSAAGNVTVPELQLKLSMRTPPTCDVDQAASALKACLETAPPYHCSVQFDIDETAAGWHAPIPPAWLEQACEQASQLFYHQPAVYWGEGGSIPLMAMLSQQFPEAQFLITGVLGPHSNAHGPNECLRIDMAKRITGCVASVIASHYEHYHSGD